MFVLLPLAAELEGNSFVGQLQQPVWTLQLHLQSVSHVTCKASWLELTF